jgi:excisionase family DNA binding protein
MQRSEQHPILTVTQAAAQEHVHRTTILRRLAAGELRGRLVGGRWLVDAKSVAEFGRDGQR